MEEMEINIYFNITQQQQQHKQQQQMDWNEYPSGELENLPMYIRITVGLLIIVILIVGTIGNTMVMMVISCSRDMRTSTNFFLVNLSVADLLVLIVVTPTALLEVVYHPDIWLLGRTMCKIVPMLELLVCHASVLTILAISFERYYAICSPLKVLCIFTKTRAVYICVFVWIAAFLITSPLIFMSEYVEISYNGTTLTTSRCILAAGTTLPDLYTFSTIIIFFLLPFAILLLTFNKISHKLTKDHSSPLNTKNNQHHEKARGQVVLMLKTVMITFFLCLLPFRLLTVTVLLSDFDTNNNIYICILYFSRVMTYINSALNPILYNVMSSKFKNGFKRLCCGGGGRGNGKNRSTFVFSRNGTYLTTTSHTTGTTGTTTNNNTGSATTSPELTTLASGRMMIRKVETCINQWNHHHQPKSQIRGCESIL